MAKAAPRTKEISPRWQRQTVSGLTPYTHQLGTAARRVDSSDVPAIKGMLARGDPQSDIAAYFGTNGGRISEINTGRKYADVRPMVPELLPPPGPYPAARSALKAKETLVALRDLISDTLAQIELWEMNREEMQ